MNDYDDESSEDKLTDEQKLWLTVSKIKEATVSQSKNNCHILIWDLINKGLKTIEIDNIFSKLEDDEKVIEIVSKPKKLTNDPYEYENTDIVIKVLNKFNKYYRELADIFGLSIDRLNGLNFLKVLDVMSEIKEQLNITDENTVRIPLWQQIIRYHSLMPADSDGLRDRYCQFRHEAVIFLKKIKAIDDFEIIKAYQRWDSKIEIKVNRLNFNEALKQLDARWRKFSKEDRQRMLGIRPDTDKEKADESPEKQLSYNSKDCVLIIGQHKVQVPKDTDQSELCRVIFSDKESMTKQWGYDEIHKSWKGIDNYNPKNWAKFYHAAYAVNEKIEKATQIKNFLMPTKKEVSINEIYLEKYLDNKVETES